MATDVPQPIVEEAVGDLLEQQFADGLHLGVQVAARWRGRTVVDLAYGWLDPEATRPVRPDSLFCCFSVTKALAAIEVWKLLADGRLRADQPVAEVWPGFRAPVTVAQLLSHQGALHRAPRPLDTGFLVEDATGLAWVAALEPAWPPGEAGGYHTLTYGWLVRGLVEAATGAPFPRRLAADVFIGLPEGEEDRAAVVVERAASRGLGWLAAGEDPAIAAGEHPAIAAVVHPAIAAVVHPAIAAVVHPAIAAMDPAFVPDWNDPRVRAACQPAFSGWASARALVAHLDALEPALFAGPTELVVDGVDRCLELPVRRGLGVELGGRFEGGAVGALGPHQRSFGHGGHGGQVVVRDPDAELTMAVLVNLLAEPEVAAERTTTICELIRALCDAY